MAGPPAGPSRRRSVASPRYKTTHMGQRLSGVAAGVNNGSQRVSMSQWLDNTSSVDVPVAVEVAYKLWDERGMIPNWMPWIKSVVVQQTEPRLSRWTLSTRQFGRDWEFSWLARNLTPVRNQKIHWISEPGTTSMPGIEVPNRGQIRFIKRSPTTCNVSLTISYAVPDPLAPFANALTPLVTSVLDTDMQRFKAFAVQHAATLPAPAKAT